MFPSGGLLELTSTDHENNCITVVLSSQAKCALALMWYPCMAIIVSVQYNGVFLPDIILLTLCY